MKILLYTIILTLPLLFSCTEPNKKIDLNKEYIFQLTDSVIENQGEFELVWNFNELDTTSFQKHEVNILDSIDREIVISVSGFTGCSSGCSGHLLYIFHPIDHSLISVRQLPINLEFLDLNSDGKNEIYTKNLIMWMGTCYEYHSIFEADKEDLVYHFSADSPEFCGFEKEDLADGVDTLLNIAELEFIDLNKDNIQEIIVNRRIKTIYDEKEKLVLDTLFVDLD